MKAFEDCFPDRLVHALRLIIRLGIIGFCQTMFDPMTLKAAMQS